MEMEKLAVFLAVGTKAIEARDRSVATFADITGAFGLLQLGSLLLSFPVFVDCTAHKFLLSQNGPAWPVH